jgi:copper(I)-binding protein
MVHIAGSYHTMCVRPGQRLHEGDTITIRGEAPNEGATIPRGRISKA